MIFVASDSDFCVQSWIDSAISLQRQLLISSRQDIFILLPAIKDKTRDVYGELYFFFSTYFSFDGDKNHLRTLGFALNFDCAHSSDMTLNARLHARASVEQDRINIRTEQNRKVE